jgi:23S rRNA (cytidine1920-2'-O)/16S rRNA (cytidine1409-2'-O)-methyltransferase
MSRPPRRRLDELLVERGLAENRSRAQALVMAGRVLVAGAPVAKAGTPVAPDADVAVTRPARYVSRGGEKLETALRALDVDVRGERCLDLGSSTGGFTDALLQHGAEHVVCVDVGRGLLHERLRADPRVTVREGVNARTLEPGMLPYRPTFLTADLSFISLRLVVDAAVACAAERWRGLVLVKPQFEAGRADAPKGVVRDPAVRARALGVVADAVRAAGGAVLGVCDSNLPGPAGNREYLPYVAAHGHPDEMEPADAERAIRHATGA